MARGSLAARNDYLAGRVRRGDAGTAKVIAKTIRLGQQFARCAFKIRRKVRHKPHARFGLRVIEREFPRVQHGTRKFSGARAGVIPISQNWMTEMLKMDPNLVRATTVQTALE